MKKPLYAAKLTVEVTPTMPKTVARFDALARFIVSQPMIANARALMPDAAAIMGEDFHVAPKGDGFLVKEQGAGGRRVATVFLAR